MKEYYAAVDIGASSGRLMLACLEDGQIRMEEIHRFENGLVEKNGHLCWDLDHLFAEIKNGLLRCRELGRIPSTLGIDTWGVDFVLLDENDQILGESIGYRDSRTRGMDEEVKKYLSEEELYGRTGIQKQLFNSIYQLMAIKLETPELLARAKSFLMVPDYLHFLLTGRKSNEYTNATTSQLVSPGTKDWDYDLIERLGYPREIFLPLSVPGSSLGWIRPELAKELGFSFEVILPATHDTGSAVLAVPSNEKDTLYLSSGTWSLMGVEALEANCTDRARACNFTNEGGYEYRYRFLKNIMGLWMIQSIKKEYRDHYSFVELCDLAEESYCESMVDCNDESFLAPESMKDAIAKYCVRTKQKIPEHPGDYARVVYRSLASCYRRTLEEIEELQGIHYKTLYIVGGGSNAEYLNRLTALETNLRVSAGPGEATAIGNLLVQMLAKGAFLSLAEARSAVARSFDVKVDEGKL